MQIKVNHDDPRSVLVSALSLLKIWLDGLDVPANEHTIIPEEDMLEAQAAAHHQIPDDFDDGTLDIPPPPPTPIPDVPTTTTLPAQHQDESDGYPERDKGGDGVRWDERIHSANHKMTTRGVWNRRRNVPDDVFNAVMEELQAEVTTASQVFNPTPMTVTPTDPAPATDIPPPPGATGAIPPTPAPTGVDWGTVFQRIMTGVSTEQVTMQQVDRAIDSVAPGKVFADLVTLPEHWESVLMGLNL